MKLKKLFEDIANTVMQQKVDDHEATMAIADLKQLAEQAAELAEMIKPGDELEGWVQAKITKAADYIESAHKYYAYGPDSMDGCSDCGTTSESMQPNMSYGDQIFSNINTLKSVASKLSKPENYTVLSNQKGDKVMLATNNRAAEFVKTGEWMKVGKIDPTGQYREEDMMMEGKSTCCGRCGHFHVKGTSCPKPFLTGKRHCRNRPK